MAEDRNHNYQSCCRLCLCDKTDSLTSVFDDATADRTLPQKILAFVAVEMATTDKLSTLVCEDCINKVNNWQKYKEECSENQTKLDQWLQAISSTPAEKAPEINIQIKEEPMDAPHEPEPEPHPETEPQLEPEPERQPEQTETNGHIEFPIKPEPMEEDYEFPPPLLTHYAHSPQLGEEDDDSQNSAASESHPKKCNYCDKMFSTPGNRKKHERHIHGKVPTSNSSAGTLSMDERSQNSIDSDRSCVKPVPIKPPIIDSEQQKIQFAAGLKLLQTNETPISFEPLSKIELSYIEKCKAMATMYKTFECACHNVSHPNLKGLLSHLRSIRIWFPVFTCYNCMITFTDRSTFTKHNIKCHRSSIEALIQLSHLRKRSEVKTRLYQNFKCTECRFMFSFHDEFCKHVNEEHILGSPPYTCACTRTFSDIEEYKDHVYVSCLVEFYCDICFVTEVTLEGFQKHAAEVHDNSEGFVLLQDDNYRMRKSMPSTTKPELENVILTTKRRSSFYTKRTIDPDYEEYRPTPTRVLNPMSKKSPTKCPICPKIYSNNANMLRHYKTHTQEEMNGEESMDDDVSSDAYYSCPDCGGMYNSTNWRKHLQEQHDDLPCSECDKVFKFQSELDQHRSVHLNLKVYRDSKTQSYKSTMLSPSDELDIIHICDVCQETFQTREDLTNHKIQLHPKQEEEIDIKPNREYECTDCNIVFTGYKALWEHDRANHPDKRTPQSKDFPKQCKYCDKMLYTGGSYYMHKQMHERHNLTNRTIARANREIEDDEEEDESYHTCKRCFKVFSSKSTLRGHMKSHGIHLSPITKTKGPKKVWCESCHLPCENLEALEQHRLEEHSMEDIPMLPGQLSGAVDIKAVLYTCDICVSTFSSKHALKKHKDTQHMTGGRGGTIVVCKFCHREFESVGVLNKHIMMEHAHKMKMVDRKQVYSCDMCPKNFQTAAALYAHQGWHKRAAIVAGGKPGKVLKNFSPIIPKSEPIVEFQCSTCLMELPNNTALQIHILEKHRNVDAIVLTSRCNTCDLEFKSQEEYENHKRLHDFLERQQQSVSIVKPKTNKPIINSSIPSSSLASRKIFQCKYCPASFTRPDNLGTHMRSVHREYSNEFVCSYCDRVFDKQSSLSIHLKMHEKQQQQQQYQQMQHKSSSKPAFSCSICNMGFNLPKDLRAHTINAHPF